MRPGRRAGFASAAYAFAVTMLGTTLPTPLYVLYRERFGFSELMVTVIFATYAGGVITALLVFGRLSDQIGRRRVLLPGLARFALSAVAFLAAQGVGLLLVGRVLSGISAGIFTGTATATLVDLAPPERRGRATLVATMANMVGLGLGPLLAGILSQSAGSPLRLTFSVYLVLLIPAAVGVWLMPEPCRADGRGRRRLQALCVPEEGASDVHPGCARRVRGFCHARLFTAVSPAFLGQALGVSSHATVGLVFAVFAASAAGQLLLERVPEAAALPAGCGALIAGMGLLALGLAELSLALLVSGGVVAGMGQGLRFRAGLSMLNARSPGEKRAEVASSFFIVAYVAISLPVVGEGVLAQAAGLKSAGLVFAAVVAALSVVALVLLARRPTT